ncbi:hypothetical protein G9F71_022465 [Clostridium sp. FP2]|uniref:sigma factor-like helix-turn-helix DNA-binding protein n=1 Tax=Clostridium sp. FP2 TaxID=2724481 RepID=UPI0013E995DD|nr:sigma factor-like helix-turn-helix DNA-binding protein [Clostridium sp. FP2]MBZ9625596.1 hypothetical protein [Clostridium sp. FP2]
MNSGCNEYIKKPNWITYDNLIKASTGFSRFVRYSNANLNNEYIELDLLRKYYISNHQSAINLIDELALRGFEFVSEKTSSILPNNTYCSDMDVLSVSIDQGNYKKLNFEEVGLGNFNDRFNVKCDMFFDGISLKSFLYFNKSINNKLLKQEFLDKGFTVGENDVDIGIVVGISQLKRPIVNEDLLISKLFNEGIFNNFNKYCYDNNLLFLRDMKNLNTDKLILLRGFGEGRINSIKERYQKYVSGEIIIQNESSSIAIPADKEGILLEEIFSENKFSVFRSYCADNNFIMAKDLTSFDFDLLCKVAGIGVGKIEIIKETFLNILSNSESHLFKGYNSTTNINKDFTSIKISYVYEENIVHYFNSIGINTIGDLSEFDTNDFSKIANVGKKKAQELTENLNLFTLSIEEYVKEKFNKITLSDGFDVYRERVLHKVTLEYIGKKLKVTRERVRQKEKKAVIAICGLLSLLDEVISQKKYFINNKNLKFDLLVDIIGSYENALLARDCLINNEFNHIKYFKELDEFFININVNIVREKLNQILEDLGNVFSFYNEMIYIEELLQENSIDFIDTLAFETFIKACGYKQYKDYYSSKKISKEFLCLIVLRDYFPLGFKNTQDNIVKMQQIVSTEYGLDQFDKENLRNTWALIDREGTSAILWGKSTKMHINNVIISDSLINKLKELIDVTLESSASISADYIYNTLENEIIEDESNIPNKEALYGVIKYYFGNHYSCKKLSIKKLDSQDLNTQIILENLLLQNNGKMLLKNIKQQLKWTEAMISSGINFNKNILCWDSGTSLLHVSKLDLPQDFRENFFVKIKSSMNDDGYVNSYMILKNATVFLMKNGINDAVSLFSLASYYFGDEFFFSRRPHILSVKTKQQFTTIQLIYKMFEDKPIISYGEIKYRMMNDFSFNEMTAGNYISKAQNNLFQIDMDLYALHTDVVLNENDEDEVFYELLNLLSDKNYVVLSEFDSCNLCKKKLKIKEQIIDWNRYIVNSIIKKNWNDCYRMIMRKGSDWRYDSTIIVAATSCFKTIDDIIIHVIETEYNDKGNMVLSQIEEFLILKKIIYNKLPEEFFSSSKVTIDEFGRVNIGR